MSVIADLLEECRAAVRSSGHMLTPYRLGLEVGSRGFDLACPYTTHRGSKLYREGVAFGLKTARVKEGEA